MECKICYLENVTEDNFITLDCSHSLCQLCLDKLVKKCCPFCRREIDVQKYFPNIIIDNNLNQNISEYEINIIIEIDIPTNNNLRIERRRQRREQRRERRDRQRNSRIERECIIPTIVSENDINEITRTLNTYYESNINDIKKQKSRNKKNRWKNSNFKKRYNKKF